MTDCNICNRCNADKLQAVPAICRIWQENTFCNKNSICITLLIDISQNENQHGFLLENT